MNATTVRPEIELGPIRPPQRLAPFSYALGAEVRHPETAIVPERSEGDAFGRLILLHDPEGAEAWDGTMRLVAYIQADLDSSEAIDPLLPEVAAGVVEPKRIAVPLTGVPVREPLVLAVAVVLLLALFCSFGVVVGIYAESWDHTAFVTNIVILPLTFLGGVFYSVDTLPSPWHEISHANPIFYLLNAVRYGFLGTSDVSVALSLAITGALAAAMVAWSSWLFRTGHRLKP